MLSLAELPDEASLQPIDAGVDGIDIPPLIE